MAKHEYSGVIRVLVVYIRCETFFKCGSRLFLTQETTVTKNVIVSLGIGTFTNFKR
jgi:hypothetical protein